MDTISVCALVALYTLAVGCGLVALAEMFLNRKDG